MAVYVGVLQLAHPLHLGGDGVLFVVGVGVAVAMGYFTLVRALFGVFGG